MPNSWLARVSATQSTDRALASGKPQESPIWHLGLLPREQPGLSGRQQALPWIAARLGAGPDTLAWVEEAGGKPRLQGGPPALSGVGISHSGGLLALALGPGSCGLDLEDCGRRRHWQEIAGAFFTPAEAGYLETSPDLPRDFYLLWTAREAWLKFHGLSVWDLGLCPTPKEFGGRLVQWLLSRGDRTWVLSWYTETGPGHTPGPRTQAGSLAQIHWDLPEGIQIRETGLPWLQG